MAVEVVWGGFSIVSIFTRPPVVRGIRSLFGCVLFSECVPSLLLVCGVRPYLNVVENCSYSAPARSLDLDVFHDIFIYCPGLTSLSLSIAAGR